MEFLLLASAHFVALLSPGPDFFLILQASLRLPLRYAISVCVGIAAANVVYLCCAVLGLEVVREMDGLMTVLRILGAIYLVFIGRNVCNRRTYKIPKEKWSAIIRRNIIIIMVFVVTVKWVLALGLRQTVIIG